MIIDGHAHSCGGYFSPDSIIKTLDNSGVDKVILVPGESGSKVEYHLPNLSQLFPNRNVVKITNFLTKFAIGLTSLIDQIPIGNEYVYNLKLETNGRVIQFIWITTHIPDHLDYLDKKLSDWNFSGVKLHQCWDNFSIDSKFFKETALWTEKNNLPLFIHLYSDMEVKKIIDYKKEHTSLKLIIAHLFGLELFIKENLTWENLYFDLSSSYLVSTKRLMKALNLFGVEHLLLGSDTPYGKNNLQKNIDRINRLDIPDNDKKLILGENLSRLLMK